MNEDISRNVLEVCESLGFSARSYSGRGMYGRNCIGITCEGNTYQVVVSIVLGLIALGVAEAAEHFTEYGSVASDNMGLGSIVYFPTLPWVNLSDDGDSDSDELDD
jgi:hypothetical protein